MSDSVQRLVLASSNTGKLLELQTLLVNYEVHVISQGELGIDAPDEPHPSFVENALAKARHASRLSGLPALADDSGICIHALQNTPGVHSARWSSMRGGPAGDAANNQMVNRQLEGLSSGASFVCVLVFLRSADDPVPVIAEGLWHGHWLSAPRGDRGFGYDPHFLPQGMKKTAAEMSVVQKNKHSHRALAMRAMVRQLKGRGILVPRNHSNH